MTGETPSPPPTYEDSKSPESASALRALSFPQNSPTSYREGLRLKGSTPGAPQLNSMRGRATLGQEKGGHVPEHAYKVLTQKDRYFQGKFDPEKLEAALNAYASEGWKVVGAATADIPTLGRTRQEMVVILEREGA
jgi:Domain of unknown function (DUF4177)